MKNDISTADDIVFLVKTFYTEATKDDLIGDFFSKVVHLDMDIHIPKISEFWRSVLLGSGNYRGNPIIKHIELNQKRKLGQKEFDRWIQLWNDTIDANFSGDKADEAKSKAQTMAKLMLIKIASSTNKGFIY